MADEEHEETGESTAPDAETEEVEGEPRADPELSAVEDGLAEAIVADSMVGNEEKQEQEEQAAMPEDVPPDNVREDAEKQEQVEQTDVPPETVDEPRPEAAVVDESGAPETMHEPQPEAAVVDESGAPETVDEPRPDAAVADESRGVLPEPESGGEPLEDVGTPEGDMQQQLDSTEAEVIVPAVTDEEPVAAESVEPPEDEGLLEVVDDGYKDTVIGRPSETEDEGMGVDDVQQSAEQLADEPSEVVPYPSADDIDIIGEEAAELITSESELDELADLDEGDKPDPTRVTEQIGPVQECPEVPAPPPLLLEGRDDIETPADESTVPSVLVCFFLSHFYLSLLY